MQERLKALQPWMNYELYSSIEKQKNEKERYRAQQKEEYKILLKRQGVDIRKVDWSKIEFTEAGFPDDENNSIEVIE